MSKRREQFTDLVSGKGGGGKTELVKFFCMKYPLDRKILVLNPKKEVKYKELGFERITYLSELAKPENKNKRLFEYVPAPILEKGKKGAKIESNEKMLDRVFYNINQLATKRYFNGLLIIDDATTLFRFSDNQHVRDTVTTQGQKDLDIIFIFHGLNNIPRFLSGEIDNYFIFAADGISNSTVKGKIPNRVILAQEVVNYWRDFVFAQISSSQNSTYYQKLILNEYNEFQRVAVYDGKAMYDEYVKNKQDVSEWY